MPAEDLRLDNLPLDHRTAGMFVANLIDDDLLSIMEGACEELSMANYESLSNISPDVIRKAYKMSVCVMGQASTGLMLKYNELWEEDGL